jgi:hypothetical protein
VRFLVSVLDTAFATADEGEMDAVTAFNDRLRATHQLVMAVGVTPEGARVIDHRDQLSVTPGLFVETAEYVTGFWVIEASDWEEAERLASEASRCCNRRVELRQIL